MTALGLSSPLGGSCQHMRKEGLDAGIEASPHMPVAGRCLCETGYQGHRGTEPGARVKTGAASSLALPGVGAGSSAVSVAVAAGRSTPMLCLESVRLCWLDVPLP